MKVDGLGLDGVVLNCNVVIDDLDSSYLVVMFCVKSGLFVY